MARSGHDKDKGARVKAAATRAKATVPGLKPDLVATAFSGGLIPPLPPKCESSAAVNPLAFTQMRIEWGIAQWSLMLFRRIPGQKHPDAKSAQSLPTPVGGQAGSRFHRNANREGV